MGNILFYIAGSIALLAFILAAIRFFRGPGIVNRVVAFDVLTIISIAIIASLTLFAGRVIYFDVAIVYGLLSFLGVIVVAKYLEGGM